MSGVYILLNETKSTDDELYIKIGCSKNIDKRIKQNKRSYRYNGNLDELSKNTKIYCIKYKELEKTLHTCLRCYKIPTLNRNEWFKVNIDKLNERLFLLDMDRYK